MSLAIFVTVLCAAVLHATWNFAAKRVAGHLGTLWLGLCLGSVVSWPVAGIVALSSPLTLPGVGYILATGVIHAWYFGLLAKAYATGEISVVYPVARGTGVAGTAVVAGLWLHEALSPTGVVGIAAVCLGTAVLGWSQRHGSLGAYVHALGVGVSILGYSIVDKLAVQHVHPVVYISGMFTVATALLAPYVLRQHGSTVFTGYRQQWRHAWLIGLGSITTYLMILFALRHGPASYIVAMREFAVVIGAVLGVVRLHEALTTRKVVGIAAITLGLILVKLA